MTSSAGPPLGGEGAISLQDELFVGVAVLGGAVCLYRLLFLLRAPGLQRALLCGMIGFPALGYLVAWPPAYRWVDASTGIPNLAALLCGVGAVLFALCAQLWSVVAIYPAGQRRRRMLTRLAGFGSALLVMVSLFIAAPVDREAPRFTATYATTRWVAPLLLVYLGVLAWGLVGLAGLGWRWSGQAAQRPLRVELRLIAAGSMAALGYVVAEGGYLLLRTAGSDHAWLGAWAGPAGSAAGGGVLLLRAASSPDWIDTLASWFATVGAVLLLAGFSTPGTLHLTQWVRQWRAYQRLHPLWQQLTAAVPEVVLPGTEGPRRPWLAVQDLDTLLYRRVVECRDARLQLRQWIDPAVAEHVRRACAEAGVTGVAAAAAVEAAQLRAALDARAHDVPPSTASTEQDWVDHGGGDLTSETRWLLLVARWFAAPPGLPDPGEGVPQRDRRAAAQQDDRQ